jgi:choice-of-anchor B domain-containing protein
MFFKTFCSAVLAGALTPCVFAVGTFESENVTLHSWLDLSDFGNPSNGSDCWGYTSPSGREYALMGLYDKMSVVEITNPNNPTIVGSISHSGSLWADIKVYQDVAYVSNENGGGIDVVDLANVDDGVVTLVQRMTLGGVSSSHNVVVDEESGFLYLAGGNNGGRLVAYGLTNPRYPTLDGLMTSGSGLHDAQVVTYTSGPYAGKQICFGFAPGAGVLIIDVTDKSNMFLIATADYSNESTCHQGWIGADYNYLYVNDEGDSNPQTIVFDVSDLSNPIEVNRFGWGEDTIDHNLYVRGTILYEANYQSGLRIFDLAVDPVNPPLVGFFDSYPEGNSESFNGMWSCFPFFDSGIVIGSDMERGLFVMSFEVPDPCNAPLDTCAIDIDGNGTVGVGDLLAVIENWGVCGDGTFRPTGDVNGDCCVNVSDVLEIVKQWGTECVITGACCLSDFSCTEVSESTCAKVGGSYFGDESLCVDTNCPGAGDECATALVAMLGENLFDTTSATPSSPEPDESLCQGTALAWDNSQDIWFEWVAEFSGNAHFTTCDASSYDTSMAIYAGSCTNQVACNGDASGEDGCQDWYSSVDVKVKIGNTYYIRIGGWQAATGSGTLTIK